MWCGPCNLEAKCVLPNLYNKYGQCGGEFLLQLQHPPLEVVARLLEHLRLTDLGEHQQQDHRAEAAADRVQEREAEDLHVATSEPRALHGQSLAGLRNAPSVRRASAQ